MCPDLLDLIEGYEPDLGSRTRVRFVATADEDPTNHTNGSK